MVRKIPTAENPRMTGRAAPAAAAGTTPACARPNEAEPAMKHGSPRAVGSPSGERAAGAVPAAAVVSSVVVRVLFGYSIRSQNDSLTV